MRHSKIEQLLMSTGYLTGNAALPAEPAEPSAPDTAPAIRLVDELFAQAVEQDASDIHLEPRETDMAVRLRVDGLLRQVSTIPRELQSSVIARIKVLGSMDVAEHRLPQDGRCSFGLEGRDIDLRISTLPTVHGEKAVVRLLYKSDALLTPAGIGLSGDNLTKYTHLLENTSGVILLVGPTGSGKSATMYTMVNALNTEDKNLITLEDPVEYRLPGINQVQINEKTGLTFASGLRAILRQDPDIIAVGEIRDGETADTAMRCAITGHLVLSTLHTNDSVSAIDRLRDMGVERYLIAAGLKGIISQRLVRRVCPNCTEAYQPAMEEQQLLGLEYSPQRVFHRGRGCPACYHSGYKGRTAVFEILIITEELRHAISEGIPGSQLQPLLQKSGFQPLLLDCVQLVEGGITTTEEAYRAARGGVWL